MFKNVRNQRHLVARVFLGGLLLGAVGGLAHQARASQWRTFPADSHCVKESSSTPSWICGVNMGSDFLPTALTSVEIDFQYSNSETDSIRAVACSEAWNRVVSTCSAPSYLVLDSTHSAALAGQLYPDTSVMKGGSTYDFRYVGISSKSTRTWLDVKGVYMAGN